MNRLFFLFRIAVLFSVVLLFSNCSKDVTTQDQSDSDIVYIKEPGGSQLRQFHIYCPDGPPGCDYDPETDCCVICEGVNGNCLPDVIITPPDKSYSSTDNSVDLQQLYSDLRKYILHDEENNTHVNGQVSSFFNSEDWIPLFPYLDQFPDVITLLQTGQAKLIAKDCVEKGGEIIISTFIHAVPLNIDAGSFEPGDQYFSIKYVL